MPGRHPRDLDFDWGLNWADESHGPRHRFDEGDQAQPLRSGGWVDPSSPASLVDSDGGITALLPSDAGPNTLNGGSGGETFSGGGSGDTINGGGGNDVLYGYGPSDTDPNSGAITATRVATGLSSPIFASSPPGDPDRLFIVEQHTGAIKILDLTTGQVLATPFLDIPDSQLAGSGEQGLLGMAFHPDYATNGKFYLYMTVADGDIEVREYTRSANPDVANTSYSVVLAFDHPSDTNHNGGWLGFGPDGYLWIATGDGGGGGDVNNYAQNLDSYLGKLLRIDVNGDDFPGDANRNYAIPDDNPFVGVSGLDEIWGYGLRNPWRCSFDPVTGGLYIADVGQGQREEVNFVPAGTPGGINFGWHVMEGDLPYDTNTPGNPPANDPSLWDPTVVYGHNGTTGGFSITGGYAYYGPGGAQGVYFFADYVSGHIWSASIGDDGQLYDFTMRDAQIQASAGTVNQISSFAVDGDGRLYAIGLDGEMFRLTPSTSASDGGDTISGGAGDDLIYGGAGVDSLTGGTENDEIHGGLANDFLGGNEGNDRLYGDAGDDQIEGGDGNDEILGGAGNDQISGGDGADVITGGDGNDVMNGSFGDDVLLSGAGNDIFLGDEEFAGDDWIDTVDFRNAAVGITANISTTTSQNTGEGMDSFWWVNNLLGSAFNDTFTGTATANTFDGGAGNDILNGGDGNDILEGGLGDDVINGGAGTNDRADYRDAASAVTINLTLTAAQNTGGAGTDTLSGIEQVLGSAFNDSLTGDALGNTLDGKDGADTLNGGAGGDILIGGLGADVLNGGGDLDYASYINAVAAVGVNLTTGVHTGEAAGDTFANIERFRLGAFNDSFTGGTNTDYAYGAEGSDTLNGAGGIDRLYGQADNDTLNGDAGNDILLGGAGADVHNGGADRDTASYEESSVAITINLTTGVHSGDATGDTWNSIEILWLSAFNDTFTGAGGVDEVRGANGGDILNGMGGADILRGEGGTDTLNGDEGDDLLNGGVGADALNGGNGVDTAVYLLATGGVTINLTSGSHTGEAAGDTFTSVERFQLSNGFTLADSFTGGAGNDWVAGYKGVDTLNGMGGDDTLNGGEHNDVLNGGAGLDKLIAGIGNDSLTGGTESDQFYFNVGAFGNDTITDWENGVDFIRITNQPGIDNINDLVITQNGAHVLITLPDGSTITVNDTLVAEMDASDFLWI